MALFYVQSKYTGSAKLVAADNGVARRDLGRAFRAGYEAALLRWHERYRPIHFTRAAYPRYGYSRRAGEKFAPYSKPWTKSYIGRKWAAGPRLVGEHHTNPLVYTGRSRTLAMIRDVRATANGGRCVIHARALNWHNPKSPIDMRDEMTRVNEQEQRDMGVLFQGAMDRAMAVVFQEREARRAARVAN